MKKLMIIYSESSIRTRAKHIWEHLGRPDGKDKEIWAQAEYELENNIVFADKTNDQYTEDGIFIDWGSRQINKRE
jgi:hypothetical protein